MKFGITQDFPCSYLEQQHERLLMVVDEDDALNSDHYETLLHNGFRRSGDQVYRPHCASCNACQSLRVPVSTFRPSKSQKRILNKNSDLTLMYSRQSNDGYFPLYANYIEQRHADGSMYPPDQQQFENFIHSKWLPGIFIECYQGGETGGSGGH